jgi:P-type Ca2+ transporter type 2C
MWRGIVFVGVIMAAGTLFALDISLPGGFVDGSGSLRSAQTMAFTTLMLFQIFNVVNARSDDSSAFVGLFTNHWLWIAMALSVALQVTVVYVPVLQQAFGTVGLSVGDWLRCIAIASSVLWLREIDKLFTRLRH